MKAFLAVLLAAVSASGEPDADPAVLYSYATAAHRPLTYGLPLTYAHHAVAQAYVPTFHPYAYHGLKSAPCVNHLNQAVPCAGRRKRSPEAEPAADAEADAEAWYGYSGYWPGYRGYGYGRYGYHRPGYYGRYWGAAPAAEAEEAPVPAVKAAAAEDTAPAETVDKPFVHFGYPYRYWGWPAVKEVEAPAAVVKAAKEHKPYYYPYAYHHGYYPYHYTHQRFGWPAVKKAAETAVMEE